MTKHDRIDQYTQSMARLQRIWAYLLSRKMRLYRMAPKE